MNPKSDTEIPDSMRETLLTADRMETIEKKFRIDQKVIDRGFREDYVINGIIKEGEIFLAQYKLWREECNMKVCLQLLLTVIG